VMSAPFYGFSSLALDSNWMLPWDRIDRIPIQCPHNCSSQGIPSRSPSIWTFGQFFR
jgi:hypothetical protein